MSPETTQGKVYPAAVASHEEILRNPALFMDSLRRFHLDLGTRFMIPVIGGKELDLHLLYLEVTKRGGLEKVVAERKWKEVIAAFNFPPTTTSASFVLRKYYISLLHHYEKVYFFRLEGAVVPPAVTAPMKSPPSRDTGVDLSVSASDTMKIHQQQGEEQQMNIPMKRKKEFPDLQIGELPSFPVIGTINAKFDHGYLVTVKIGSEILHGVLFHPSSTPRLAATPQSAYQSSLVPLPAPPQARLRQRRKIARRRRDPAHPKPNRSAYNFFFAEKHSTLKRLYPQREREFSKMIGESWNKLTQEERMVYHDSGLKDKERYKREMLEYRERLNLVQPKEVVKPMDVFIAGPSTNMDSKSETTTSDA